MKLTEVWQRMDEEIANTLMPEAYRNSHVEILCRDCHKVINVSHFVFEARNVWV